jgi:hypothetical protein
VFEDLCLFSWLFWSRTWTVAESEVVVVETEVVWSELSLVRGNLSCLAYRPDERRVFSPHSRFAACSRHTYSTYMHKILHSSFSWIKSNYALCLVCVERVMICSMQMFIEIRLTTGVNLGFAMCGRCWLSPRQQRPQMVSIMVVSTSLKPRCRRRAALHSSGRDVYLA